MVDRRLRAERRRVGGDGDDGRGDPRIARVLGHEQSAEQDSFMAGLLDHPHYTRPEEIDGATVPAVLVQGDHEAIRRWRLKQALGRTWLERPDLLQSLPLTGEQQTLLAEFKRERGI